jgi:RNA polymerase sigma-70 factor (ECF subfamily)
MFPTPVSLLLRLRNPDNRDAWGAFIDLYTPVLQRWADHLTAHPAEADDLVQDVFVILLRKMPGFQHQPGKSFRAWLKVVTRHAWLARCRRTGREDPGPLPERIDPNADPVQQFWEREYREQLVSRALDLMRADFDPRTVEAALASLRDGKSAAEISRETGLTPAAVYAARARVLRRLRADLDGFLES